MAASARAESSVNGDGPTVEVVDFRRPAKFTREHIWRLGHAHETFCRSAATRLATELRTGVELSVGEIEQVPFGAVVLESTTRSLITTIQVQPVDTRIALLVDLRLALLFVDRLLGGSGEVATEGEPDDPTDLEVAVARKAIAGIVDTLSTTWLDLAGVTLAPGPTTTSTLAPQIVSPSEATLALNLEVRIDGLESRIVLLLPYASMLPILDRLEFRRGEGPPADAETAAALEAAVRRVEVDVRVEVGALELPLREVLALRPGDVLPLRRPAAEGVTVCIGDLPTYVAQPGRDGARKAVQIVRRWGSAG